MRDKSGIAAAKTLEFCGGGVLTDLLMADETKQRLLLNLGSALVGQTASAPHMIVSL